MESSLAQFPTTEKQPNGDFPILGGFLSSACYLPICYLALLPSMITCFQASQSIDLTVPELSIPVQHYLRQPKRLIQSLVDPSRVDSLEDDLFRLKMRPLNFLMLHIQPTVDLRLNARADGGIQLRSEGCEVRGVEYVNERFHLSLEGVLTPTLVYGQTRLQGRADLQVQVELPPILWITPKPLVEATGNGLLKSVLLTIKQRLTHQLLFDYRAWVIAQTKGISGLQEGEPDVRLAPKSSAI